MKIVSKIEDWLAYRATLLGEQVGFVPTMGHLHEGHLSLCARAKSENDRVVMSIFVNPTQFNQQSDYDHYPRSIDHDIALLESSGVDCLWMPDESELYPDDYQVQVIETEISQHLEGQYRPGHFNGVLTVVMKLLNLVRPSRAYFGEKDYQQFLLVKKMVLSLFLPVEVVACETIRASDGLALSSRNSRLSPTSRVQAALFPRMLMEGGSPESLSSALSAAGFKVDYVVEKWGRRLGAVWLDDIRLIDNVVIQQDE